MKFSLVIPLAPYRNAEIIHSIENLDYSRKEFQVIVVKSLNPSNNRNRGAKKAKGEIIAFLDDDAVIESDFLRKAEDFFEKHPEVDIVGGPQLTPKDDEGFAKISGYALSSKFGAWKMVSRYESKKLNLNADETQLTSANLFVKKEVMNEVKFDPRLWPGEDPDFITKAKGKGFKVAYSPDIVVYHKRRATIKAFAKQIFSYGKTRTMKESFFKTLKRPFFLVPSIFFLYLIILLISIILKPSVTGNVIGISKVGLNSLLFLPLILYLILDLVFSVYEAIKNRNFTAFFPLLLIFPLLHLSYGIGMLYNYINPPLSLTSPCFFLFFH